MRNILLFSVLVFVFIVVSGCEHGLNSTDVLNTITASSIRNVAYDPVANCAVEQVHQHNGDYYGGHYNNDTHSHQGLHADGICTINTCEDTGLHQHNGTYYAGHHGSDGHGGHGNENGHHGKYH